jgi:hypothetical protein
MIGSLFELMRTQGLDLDTMFIFVDCKSKRIDIHPVCIKIITIGTRKDQSEIKNKEMFRESGIVIEGVEN